MEVLGLDGNIIRCPVWQGNCGVKQVNLSMIGQDRSRYAHGIRGFSRMFDDSVICLSLFSDIIGIKDKVIATSPRQSFKKRVSILGAFFFEVDAPRKQASGRNGSEDKK